METAGSAGQPVLELTDIGKEFGAIRALHGVDMQVFFATHQPIPSLEHHYVKVAKVRAYITIEEITLTTRLKDSTEMIAIVPIGAVVVQNPSGEEYAMTVEEFERRYMPDE